MHSQATIINVKIHETCIPNTQKCRFMGKRVREISCFFVAPWREFAPAVCARPRNPFSINTSTLVHKMRKYGHRRPAVTPFFCKKRYQLLQFGQLAACSSEPPTGWSVKLCAVADFSVVSVWNNGLKKNKKIVVQMTTDTEKNCKNDHRISGQFCVFWNAHHWKIRHR